MNALLEKPLLTFDEFVQTADNKGFELEEGHLVEKTVSILSSHVAFVLTLKLGQFVLQNKLGQVFGSDMLYRCFPNQPGTGRRPDVSFIAKDRLPLTWIEEAYFSIPPDLAVEVISPNDLATEVDHKIQQYLEAGVKLVWVVNPEERLVLVHRLDGSVAKLKEVDPLQGEDVVAGFTCRVGELFPLR